LERKIYIARTILYPIMVKALVIFLLFISTAAAQCTPYWICDDWSSCEYGFQTRDCRDLADCEDVEDIPVQTKRCDDPEEYEVANEEINEQQGRQVVSVQEPLQEQAENLSNVTAALPEDEPQEQASILVGLLIVAVFAVIGILVGRSIRSQ
jgi:hypothetical protein